MNIVIIDDDKLVAVSLKTILESTGSVKVLAMGSCGEEAIELYSLLKPDVLLMDIRMKNMSGLEASALILKEFPDARILLLTTFSDDEYIITQTNKGEPAVSNKKSPSGRGYMEIAQRLLGENIEITIPGRNNGFVSKLLDIFKKK